MSNRILLVDDEPAVLKIYEKSLGGRYDLESATSGSEALEIVKTKGPFAVVVSDMEMPNMRGVELLAEVRKLEEQTIRIIMTGNTDFHTAIQAINEGNIYRFLAKPCTPDTLAQTLDAALQQYQLVTAEAELLNNTLSGSIRMLVQVLSLAMPEAFGLSQEAKNLTRKIASILDAKPLWQLEMAAMLMRIGCVSLPDDVLANYLGDQPLNDEQEKLISETPELGYELIRAIPRLQGVAELVRAQNDPPTDKTPLGARILHVVGDFQRFQNHASTAETLKKLQNSSRYDPDVVRTLSQVVSVVCVQQEVMIDELREGMILESRIEYVGEGGILIAKGTEVHEALIQRLTMLRRDGANIREPIHVRVCRSRSDVNADQVAVPEPLAGAAQPA